MLRSRPNGYTPAPALMRCGVPARLMKGGGDRWHRTHSDPFCCGAGGGTWDSVCVREARAICGSLRCPESDGTCGHSLCTAGGPLVSSCDSERANCVAAICAPGVDPYCCSTAWDNLCIREVTSVRGKSCY
jgi:hypothetical protein